MSAGIPEFRVVPAVLAWVAYPDLDKLVLMVLVQMTHWLQKLVVHQVHLVQAVENLVVH